MNKFMAPSRGEGFDQKEFRRTLGQFATGVTIVTTRAPDGRAVGITVNSFTSVSLNPPLVLWCLAGNSACLPVFEQAAHFAIHILSASQHALSQRFALPIPNRFEGVDTEDGKDGLPLLKGVAARLICRNVKQYDGGDHAIFLGEVEECTRYGGKPLVFYSGRYHLVTRHPDLLD